jgi:FkbM family methyltransferase
MPSLVKQLANRMGYELKRKYGAMPALDFLETILLGAAAAKGVLNVVQVGANDGRHSDPIHRFLMDYRHCTRALLIEPQPELITYLEASYETHPRATVFNGAIGSGGDLVLHRIRPEHWQDFRVSYQKGAPAYRAPSGLTSANRAHVLAAAARHLGKGIDPEAAVEELRVPCTELAPLLQAQDFPSEVHLLQVDAEGADDQVLYACNIDALRPSIINFESKHLPAQRQSDLYAFLVGQGYKLFPWNKTDTAALRLAVPPGSGA